MQDARKSDVRFMSSGPMCLGSSLLWVPVNQERMETSVTDYELSTPVELIGVDTSSTSRHGEEQGGMETPHQQCGTSKPIVQ
jgi:hypothetical protein